MTRGNRICYLLFSHDPVIKNASTNDSKLFFLFNMSIINDLITIMLNQNFSLYPSKNIFWTHRVFRIRFKNTHVKFESFIKTIYVKYKSLHVQVKVSRQLQILICGILLYLILLCNSIVPFELFVSFNDIFFFFAVYDAV